MSNLNDEVLDGFDAIFAYVPEAHGEDGKELTLAQKIERLGQMHDQLRKALKHIDEITTGSLPVTYLIKEIAQTALKEDGFDLIS